MNERAFLEGFFSARTIAFGILFISQRINQQPQLIVLPERLGKRLEEDPLA